MTNKSNYEYLLSDLSNLKGVGVKTTSLLKKKKINNIFDLLFFKLSNFLSSLIIASLIISEAEP